ncbi:MAG TPA: gamma-glutamyltransferase family protein [Beijerinckiaceae bacterium]|nr:gamma-glutamyltransferase family protein [Beijerinckiaceae bacterium]
MQFTADAIYASRRSPVFARNVVAASQPLATQAGIEMLRKGGNALDAALAVAITLPVVEPTGNGIGADAFCIIWDGSTLHGLNASGRAPAAWTPSRFAGRDRMPKRGWDSVTVPGAVSAWAELSARFGRLPFKTLFEPAIRYAERGFHVTPIIAGQWQANAEALHAGPGFAEAFMPNGRAPRAGELFACPDIARSLTLIAETNGKAMYTGALAEKIAAFAKAGGGAITMEDLAAHRNDWCGTISKSIGGISLHEIPPNGQGIAACMALGILDHLGIGDYAVDSVDALHVQIEAMKLAFADVRAHVGDLSYMTNVTVDHLLDDAYLASRAKLIDPKKAKSYGPGRAGGSDTVCLATADENGMMVAYIQSNYSGFGSGVVVPGTGIALQNRGSGFSLRPGHANEVGPGKRPFHTIIPGFVTDGKNPRMAFGLMGGDMQAQGHVQMVLRTQIWNQDPQTAADAPRWRFAGGLDVAIEATAGARVLSALAERGHHVLSNADELESGFGGAQLIHRIDGGYVAGSDPRKDGQAAGF